MPSAAAAPPPRGLAHPSLAAVVRAVERTTARLPVVSPPHAIAPEPEPDAGSAGTCSTAHSSMDTDGHNSNAACGSYLSSKRQGGAAATAGAAGKSHSDDDEDTDDDDNGGEEEHYQDMSRGLDGMDSAVLRRRVEPIRKALLSIDAAGVLALEGVDTAHELGARISSNEHVRPIHDDIEPPRSRDGDTCVRYLHVAELEGSYSMGAFIFPPNSTIPLHDHPGMCVLSRVLYGTLTVRSYDVDRESKDDGAAAGDAAPPQPRAGGGGGSSDGEAPAAAKRKSSFSWVADALAGRAAAAASLASETDVGSGSGRKVPNRTGSWLSSLLFPHRRDSSSLYQQGSSTSSLGDRKPHALPSPSTAAAGAATASAASRRLHRTRNHQRHHHPPGTLRAYPNPNRGISAPAVQILYPSEGNAHEFTAGPEGAAVLDVLLPPYDFDHDRDCTFYRAEQAEESDGNGDDGGDQSEGIEEEDGGATEAMEEDTTDGNGGEGQRGDTTAPASTPAGEARRPPEKRGRCNVRGRRPCWLIPTPQPKNFHCISGTYVDFGGDDEG